MTFDECLRELTAIRRRQGTRCPLIRVDCGGSVFEGRLARSDSDPEYRGQRTSPYGVLAITSPGLTRGPETIVQIENIPSGGIRDLHDA